MFAVLATVAVTTAESDFVPLTPVGDIAAVQSVVQNEDTCLFYQQSDGAIYQRVVTGPFTDSTSTSPSVGPLVPADEAMFGTPIAACEIDSGSIEFEQVRA